MYLNLALTRHRRARVWAGILPADNRDAFSVQAITLSCTGQRAEACSFAVEIAVPRGPMASYGLLGANYQPGGSELEISVRTGIGSARQGSLAIGDYVHWGLPPEFTDAILRCALDYGEASGLPCGQISFDCAAFGEVGSSPRIFTALTGLLLRAIHLRPRPGGVDDWAWMLEGTVW